MKKYVFAIRQGNPTINYAVVEEPSPEELPQIMIRLVPKTEVKLLGAFDSNIASGIYESEKHLIDSIQSERKKYEETIRKYQSLVEENEAHVRGLEDIVTTIVDEKTTESKQIIEAGSK